MNVSIISDGYVATCTNMVWFYPKQPSYQNSLRIAIVVNTICTMLAIILNFKNCKLLLKHRRGNQQESVNIIILSGCIVDTVTAAMILIVWNVQSIMAVFHRSSCPVSFFTYLIMIVATFIICMVTILLVTDRYLIATCPFLYAEQDVSTYAKFLAYIFIIALMLSGIGFAISPHLLYFVIVILFIGCGLWSIYAFPAIIYEEFFLTPTYTSYQLKVNLHERLKQAKITKYTACHTFVTVVFTIPNLLLTYVWFQQEQNVKSLIFHSALLWSWVLVGVKLAASAFFLYRALNGNGGGTLKGMRQTQVVQIVEDITKQSIPLQNI